MEPLLPVHEWASGEKWWMACGLWRYWEGNSESGPSTGSWTPMVPPLPVGCQDPDRHHRAPSQAGHVGIEPTSNGLEPFMLPLHQ